MLAAAVALAWPLQPEKWTSVLLPSLSPHVAFAAALAVRAVGLLTLLALPVFALAMLYPRWFCRHGCPTGLLQETLQRFRPSAPLRWPRWPALGKWILLLTLGGACLGYPFFLWLDPLALFNGFLNAWRPPLAFATLAAGLGLPALLLFDLLWPRVWCQRLCPLGTAQEWLSIPWRRTPACPAATGMSLLPSSPPWRAVSARRHFLIACLGAGGAFAVRRTHGHSPPLRPPGALDENRFTGVCIRCGNCAQACPSRIIHPDLGQSGFAGFLTPRLSFDQNYCREDCHRCGQVCPSGAIARLPLAAKRLQVIGPARVNLDTCLLANGRECTACIQRCPYAAVRLQTSADGFSTAPAVDLKQCTGCGACEAACPVRPQRAIRVGEMGQALNH